MFQHIGLKVVDRGDHVWFRIRGKPFKCCICGAITGQVPPPDYPTASEWEPDRYERLTDGERGLCKNKKGKLNG